MSENMSESQKNNQTVKNPGYRGRFREIMHVLRKSKLTSGMTPEKFRGILEELGPTYIKIGQIMSARSDILPREYCEELTKLRSSVAPMPFSQVEDVINDSLGFSWKEEFSHIGKEPLGSASIAQVHKATLKNGDQVVIKVQRKGIYQTMSRDIGLLHKAVGLLPPIKIKEMIDFDMILDELWMVTQEEMNFLMEAGNMEEFARLNKDIRYINTPTLYREYTSPHIIVMKYVDGIDIDKKEELLAAGYDVHEIAAKYVDNFIKQVMEDGFFHADPHPGNVKVSDGRIIWMDMGMMGRLTERDRENVAKGIRGVALQDISLIQEAVLALGVYKSRPDQSRLYEDLQGIMDKYGGLDFGSLDIIDMTEDLMEVMQDNHIIMPHGFTLLIRALTHVQGVLLELDPSINMIEIASSRLKQDMLSPGNIKKELKTTSRTLYRSAIKAIELPGIASDFLKGSMKGQTKVNLELHAAEHLEQLLRKLVQNIVLGLWVTALLVSSSIICVTDMRPKVLGIPALGFFGYLFAFIIVFYVLARHILTK